jgi:hypothetical protein
VITVDFDPLNVQPYLNGVLLSWGQNGEGVSSACVDFTVNSSGLSSDLFSEYSVNVTTALSINGRYSMVNGSLKQTNVTCAILNEGNPALARNFSVYYEDDGSLATEEWVPALSPTLTDYYNGTYLISFTAQTLSPDNPLVVSVHCWDLRSIFVQANCTCVHS